LYARYTGDCLASAHCNGAAPQPGRRRLQGTPPMLDIVFVGTIIAFFALSAGLIRFCANLMQKGGRP